MFKNTELYKHAVSELNLLLELERQENMNTSIGDLEQEVEIFGGMTAQEFLNDQILNIISSIDSTRLSGSTMQYILDTIYTLGRYENLTPLTLDDNEFEEVSDDGNGNKLYQNKRNFKVFKSDTRGIYHIDGQHELDRACGKCPEDTPNSTND